MSVLLSKILNYELEIFEKYCQQRNTFRTFLSTQIQLNNLTNDQLLNFIENIKMVIDPLKTSTRSMESFVEGTLDHQPENDFIVFYLLFGNLFFGNISSTLVGNDNSESEEISELSDSESEPE